MRKSYIAIAAVVWVIFVAAGIMTVRSGLGTAPKLTVPARKSGAVVRLVSNPQPAPPFLVNDIDGNVVSTAGWPGKVVLLNFWATWCSPCREEIPFLIELAKKYKDGLQIVGVSLDETSPGGVKEFAKRFGISYPIVMGSAELIWEYGGVPAVPTSFVMNKHGQIVQKHEGSLSPAMIENEIRALLGLPVDGKVETFEDKGQIFPKDPARATELPGVDFRRLTPEQKKTALRRLNSEGCSCGCKLTLAQCRLTDTTCPFSKDIAAKVLEEILAINSTKNNAPSGSFSADK